MDLKSRFGTFFILLGILLLFLFIAADIVEAEELNFWYLLSGVASAGFGIYLKILGREPQEESGRFRTVRRFASRGKKTENKDDDDANGDE